MSLLDQFYIKFYTKLDLRFRAIASNYTNLYPLWIFLKSIILD